jgi:hypothetical protein
MRRHQPTSFPSWLQHPFHRKFWRSGLHAGFYASLAVLLSITALLFAGLFAYGGVVDGIGTIAIGNMQRVSRTSTAYHILINVLSTVLLTSSNYAMQILCAPTRQEMNRAHARGCWLEIGIMSFHNLWHVDRTRVLIWGLLAFTSAPLHLL